MAAITILRPREEVERLWSEARPDVEGDVTFRDAPGDRGTEVHVTAKAKDELRRFKRRVETGEVPRSYSNPEAVT